jgi:excisionase family DNA binding protein
LTRLLSLRDVQEALGIRLTKVRELIADGELESVKVGTLVRVPEDALEAYVDRLRGRAPTVPS